MVKIGQDISKFVKCEICKGYFKRITGFHTSNVHNISLQEYRIKYPNSPTESSLWKESQSNSHLGQKAWNKDKTKENDLTVLQYSKSLNGYSKTIEHCNNISKTKKEQCKNPEYVKKLLLNITRCASSVCPNIPEMKIGALLDYLYPNEWKFVGNNEFIVGKYNPDFVNINGQKKIIEVFGDYWHKDTNVQERINYFKEFGFSTLIIWEKELKDPELVMYKLIEFSSVETLHGTSNNILDEDKVRS